MTGKKNKKPRLKKSGRTFLQLIFYSFDGSLVKEKQ